MSRTGWESMTYGMVAAVTGAFAAALILAQFEFLAEGALTGLFTQVIPQVAGGQAPVTFVVASLLWRFFAARWLTLSRYRAATIGAMAAIISECMFVAVVIALASGHLFSFPEQLIIVLMVAGSMFFILMVSFPTLMLALIGAGASLAFRQWILPRLRQGRRLQDEKANVRINGRNP